MRMTVAKLLYESTCEDVYGDLLELFSHHFSNVESGFQGDAWIYIKRGTEVVSIDTFSSMQFEIRVSHPDGGLIYEVLEILESKYSLVSAGG